MGNTKTLEQLHFDNRYARLPEIFHSAHHPTPLSEMKLAHFNRSATALIALDPQQAERVDFVDIITGEKPLSGYTPIACCYAGHQFGHFVPRLGDGRAILLGEVCNDDGSRWDWQLKGAGLTRYSRQADGRAVLRSSVREYLCSEAMHGLGIGTTRALCLIASQEAVYRERVESGAMVLRMAPSHIRFGSFEYFYYAQRFDDLRLLANFTIENHFPHLLDGDRPYLALLVDVIDSTAKMIAQWQSVGFMHGVMNTDNMSIHGMTIDYGPFGFMEAYEAEKICNHSDYSGRYAYHRQPDIALFNLSCLAQAMLPLFDTDPDRSAKLAIKALDRYKTAYKSYYDEQMRRKLGLVQQHDSDPALFTALFALLQEQRIDFTRFFRALSTADTSGRRAAVHALLTNPTRADPWLQQYTERLASETVSNKARAQAMRQVNPQYILRNYMAEIAIRKAEGEGDYSEIDRLMAVLQRPFDEHPSMQHYADAPPAWAENITVSCSS